MLICLKLKLKLKKKEVKTKVVKIIILVTGMFNLFAKTIKHEDISSHS